MYFKLLDRNDQVNWDDFDELLQQILQCAMENQKTMTSFIDRHQDVMTHYSRRASRKEFPASRWMIYLNFACIVQMDGVTIDALLKYGNDVLYPKFLWPEKLQLLDTTNRANAPYKMIVFNKVTIDLMLYNYSGLVNDLGLEGVISMIAHLMSIQSADPRAFPGRVELWQKLSLVLSKAFELRHEDFEYADKQEEVPLPLQKEQIMLLAQVLITSETTGHLRDPQIINYLFKSVFELVDSRDDGHHLFSLADIALLVDAFFKSQMQLLDTYGDLFIDILNEQGFLSMAYLEN